MTVNFSKPRSTSSPTRAPEALKQTNSVSSNELLQSSETGSYDVLDEVPSFMVSPPTPKANTSTESDKRFQVPPVRGDLVVM